MSAVSRGIAAENKVGNHLEAQGWIVGGRRHRGGAADFIAVHPRHRTRCIEVKSTQRPYATFGPTDRAELKALADYLDADALLAWCPSPSGPTVRIPESQWPKAGSNGATAPAD